MKTTLEITEVVEQGFLDELNSHEGEKFTADVEGWFVVPEGESPSIASGYYEYRDQIGEREWRHTISGRLGHAALVNMPRAYSDPITEVVSIMDAKFVVDGVETPLETREGYPVLIDLKKTFDGLVALDDSVTSER